MRTLLPESNGVINGTWESKATHSAKPGHALLDPLDSLQSRQVNFRFACHSVSYAESGGLTTPEYAES